MCKYDIFSGHDDKDALWLEAVDGLDASMHRMKDLASQKPGPYFLFCTRTQAVLAAVDTARPHEQGQVVSA
jgi:hypothetical protein